MSFEANSQTKTFLTNSESFSNKSKTKKISIHKHNRMPSDNSWRTTTEMTIDYCKREGTFDRTNSDEKR